MTATLTSTNLDCDRCPKCGERMADHVAKAKAWDEIAKKNAKIARVLAALKGIAEYCSADGAPLGAMERMIAIRNTAEQALRDHEQK